MSSLFVYLLSALFHSYPLFLFFSFFFLFLLFVKEPWQPAKPPELSSEATFLYTRGVAAVESGFHLVIISLSLSHTLLLSYTLSLSLSLSYSLVHFFSFPFSLLGSSRLTSRILFSHPLLSSSSLPFSTLSCTRAFFSHSISQRSIKVLPASNRSRFPSRTVIQTYNSPPRISRQHVPRVPSISSRLSSFPSLSLSLSCFPALVHPFFSLLSRSFSPHVFPLVRRYYTSPPSSPLEASSTRVR